ncbi:hypothetical protein SAMN06272765_7027 [Streptomyces sp. Ag109_G2-15]|nr:hypothetical protein SAMN06272765_7027 [Streptomyces sp. Ag109_G2-15]
MLKLFVPKRYGGHASDMATAAQTIAEVARATVRRPGPWPC